MTQARIWIGSNRSLALALLLLALCMKALIPAGYMVTPDVKRVLTVAICADASGQMQQMQLAIAGKDPGAGHSGDTKMDGQCAFSTLGHAALGGADPLLLALAIAFILVLGLRPRDPHPLAQSAYLRPPLRGPPVAA